MYTPKRSTGERGAVSLFIVIFTALLVTTITVAFVRIMIQTQELATTSDLSKSAMDSAQAGVEDGKRAIVTYREHCLSGAAAGTAECVKLAKALNDGSRCDTIQQSGIAGNPDAKEVMIQQTEGDVELQQAYTCVKVTLNTVDYVGTFVPNMSRLIPLKATGPYDTVTIEWYSQSDLQSASTGDGGSTGKVDLGTDTSLPTLASWPTSRPALLRAQLIQHGSSFQLSDFDSRGAEAERDAATLFLFPLAGIPDTDGTNLDFSADVRSPHTSGALQPVSCNKDFSTSGAAGLYACKATIRLPNPVGETDPGKRTAYLRVSALYNAASSFRISLQNGAVPTTFSSVQPLIDSTGRANDMFRRIQSRIELDASSVPYAEAAVDLSGSLCKAFLVTDKPEDYNPGACDN